MDIYARLKDDHGKQRGLCAGLAKTSGDTAERRRLFRELKQEIEAHAAAEEQTFYAELIACAEGQEKARHSISEHKEAADILTELADMDMNTGGWLTRFKTLHDDLLHHMDEEEDEVFRLAKSLIGAERAEELASEFDVRKRAEGEG